MTARSAGNRWAWRLALALLAALTLALAVPTAIVARSARDRDPDRSVAVRAELAALRVDLDGGAGERMQEQFPEGFLFAHALHGLAWTDLAADGRADPDQARAEAERALRHVTSPAGTAPFSASLVPRFGVFHAAWVLLLQARLAALEPAGSGLHRQVRRDADVLAAAFTDVLDAGRSPFLEAYPGQSWPVDSVVAMAALRTADRAVGTDHSALVRRWVARATELVDPGTGLLPHVTEPGTGRALEGARGTSQSIIQRFWPVVDPDGSGRSYARFKELFVTSIAGFVGVREYPPGVDGAGDVDSGPLVLGLSASSTAVTIGAARAHGDLGLAAALTQESDLFGLPFGTGERRYLLGQLPVADAFLAWARATPVGPTPESGPGETVWWPLLIALPWVPVLAGWWIVIAARRIRRRAT
jgi:hypothetical protein